MLSEYEVVQGPSIVNSWAAPPTCRAGQSSGSRLDEFQRELISRSLHLEKWRVARVGWVAQKVRLLHQLEACRLYFTLEQCFVDAMQGFAYARVGARFSNSNRRRSIFTRSTFMYVVS
jgi:hypothetical protein